jgi:hypothetical protein
MKTKSTYARLAQEIGFWLSTIAQFSVAGKKAQQSCAPAERKECNKYDLTCYSVSLIGPS